MSGPRTPRRGQPTDRFALAPLGLWLLRVASLVAAVLAVRS